METFYESSTKKTLPDNQRTIKGYINSFKHCQYWLWSKGYEWNEDNLINYFDHFKAYFKGQCWSRNTGIKSVARIVYSIEMNEYVCLQRLLKKSVKSHKYKVAKSLTPQDMQDFYLRAREPEFMIPKLVMMLSQPLAARASEYGTMKVSECIKMQDKDQNGKYFIYYRCLIYRSKNKKWVPFMVTCN
jgi:hypothetical protein